MMWRCKFIFILALFFAMRVNAQIVADSAYFVKHGSYLTDLAPGNFTGVFRDLFDSLQNIIPTPSHDAQNCSITYQYVDPAKPKPDTFCLLTQIHWDKQLRLVQLKHGDCSKDPSLAFKAFYSIGMKPLYFILNTAGKDPAIDTATYHYGKSGMITSVMHHHITSKKDSVYTETRLYDSENRLIVIQNGLYGDILGTYTYEYDDMNNIVSRRFMVSSGGAILCRDTLIYSIADSVNSITSVVHKMKIGNGNWMLMDEMNKRVDGRPVMYALYFSSAEYSRLQLSRNMKLTVEYDPTNGKRVHESRTNIKTGETHEITYYYVDGMDSLHYEAIDHDKNNVAVRRLEKAEYRTYKTGTTLLDSKKIITYSSYFRKKKYNFKIESIEIVKYSWSK